MLKHLRSIVMSGLLTLPAGGATAQTVEPFYRLFPAETFRSTIREDVFQDGIRTYSGVTVNRGDLDIGMDSLSLRSTPDGDLAIEIGTMTIRPRDQTAPAISMTGLTFQMRDWPALEEGDGFCAWSDVISVADIAAAEMRLPTEPAGISSMRVQGIGFEARGQGGPCWLSGLISIDLADIYRNDGSSFGLTQFVAEVAAPGSRQSAATSQYPSGLRAELAEIEVRNAGGNPAYALSNVDMRSDMETSGLEGLLHIIRSSTFFGASANTQLNLMQLANALTLVRGEVSIEAPITRIYSAGVVPPEAVTNFSRIGLSTITGTSSLSMDMDRGALRATAAAALIGLTDLQASLELRLSPYDRVKLQAARAGKTLGAHLIPEAAVSNARLIYTDTGLEGYVRDLTGVPSGRYIQEFGALLAEQQKDDVAKSIRQATGSISGFFRYAAEQKPMVISISPDEPIRLAAMSYLALTNLRGLAGLLDVQLTQQDAGTGH